MYKSDLDVCIGVPAEFPERGVTASATSSNGWVKIGVDVAEAETSSNGSGALPSMEWAADHVVEDTIQFLVSMQATKPEILRGIMVHRFLQHAPLIWARRTGLDTLHGLSEVTTTLDEFWSHSWQVKAYLKYINILHRHNSFSAFVVGTLCAFAAWALCVAGILPDGPAWEMTSRFWSTPAGLVGYYLTLFMWRRRKKAFLDIACINQTDDLIKAEGLVSMGAFLKRSETLFVLWDVTYVSRRDAACSLSCSSQADRRSFELLRPTSTNTMRNARMSVTQRTCVHPFTSTHTHKQTHTHTHPHAHTLRLGEN